MELEQGSSGVEDSYSPSRRRASGGGQSVRWVERGFAVHGQRLSRRSQIHDPGHVGSHVDEDAGHDESS